MCLCLQVEVPCGFCIKVSVHAATFLLKTFRTVITLRIMPLPNTVKISQLFQKFTVLMLMPRAGVCKPCCLREQNYEEIGHYN